MDKNLFILTGKDLVKLSVMLLLATVFFGLTGLIVMLFFQWITLQSYAADSADKHGISQVSASRLGGLAIFISWLGLMLAGYYNGYLGGKSGGGKSGGSAGGQSGRNKSGGKPDRKPGGGRPGGRPGGKPGGKPGNRPSRPPRQPGRSKH